MSRASIAVIAVVAIAATGCVTRVVETTPSDPPATTATTVAPATTQPTPPTTPPTTPRTTQPPDPCGYVDIDATSALIPEDWDEWCKGFLVAEETFGGDVDPLACEQFWSADDDDLLIETMATGLSQSESVAFIDYLWVYC